VTLDMGDVLRDFDALEKATERSRGKEGDQGREGETADAPKRRLFLAPFEEIDAREIEPMRYLVEPHLPAGEATMLYAPPRSFKSFLTMEYALSIALGRPFLGRFESTQGVVIYLDLENRQDRLRERVRAAMQRDHIAVAALRGNLLMQDRAEGIPAWRMDPDALDELGEYVEGVAPALIIVDNFRKGLPFGVEENSNSEINPIINRLLEACERAESALLLVHHTNKGNERYSGAGALEGSVANVMKIARDQETRKAVVTSINMRNSEEFPPFAVEMDAHGALTLTTVPGSSYGDGDDHYTDVRQVLGRGGKTVIEIADALNVSRPTADKYVKSLLARGAIVIGAKKDTGGVKGAMTYWLPGY